VTIAYTIARRKYGKSRDLLAPSVAKSTLRNLYMWMMSVLEQQKLRQNLKKPPECSPAAVLHHFESLERGVSTHDQEPHQSKDQPQQHDPK
jgi:hypothetical protein